MGDLIVACSGLYIIFLVLMCGLTILDKLTCFADKTLEVMDNKKKPAYEADQNEQAKYNISAPKSQAGEGKINVRQ